MSLYEIKAVSPIEAVKRALQLVGTGTYQLGTGNNYTVAGGNSDCWGFVGSMCYGMPRHSPGFNVGPWASVSDDLNCNSAIEDAENKGEVFEVIKETDIVELGDILAYPTIPAINTKYGVAGPWIGHCSIVTGFTTYDTLVRQVCAGYKNLKVVQCCGPNGHSPAIIKSSGAHWDIHDQTWPKPEHRTRVLRVKQSINKSPGAGCVYSDDEGRHCAWGWIDEEAARDNIDGDVYAISTKLTNSLVGRQMAFASRLQVAHDRAYDSHDMKRRFIKLANDYGLTHSITTS